MSTAECFQGVIHDGAPTGKIEQINGVDTYVALPDGQYAKNKAILFLSDAFGIGLVNNQLLADGFARNGIPTYIPDYLSGEGVPDNVMSIPDFDWVGWNARHTPAHTRPILDKVISGLRERGVTTFGATGYCFGGRAAIDLAHDHVVRAVSIAHPSLLVWPDDFERLAKDGKVPLQIHSCEFDRAFPAEACAAADAILAGGKHTPGYERQHWLGCTHSFAVRGDLTQPLVKAGKEAASSVKWGGVAPERLGALQRHRAPGDTPPSLKDGEHWIRLPEPSRSLISRSPSKPEHHISAPGVLPELSQSSLRATERCDR